MDDQKAGQEERAELFRQAINEAMEKRQPIVITRAHQGRVDMMVVLPQDDGQSVTHQMSFGHGTARHLAQRLTAAADMAETQQQLGKASQAANE